MKASHQQDNAGDAPSCCPPHASGPTAAAAPDPSPSPIDQKNKGETERQAGDSQPPAPRHNHSIRAQPGQLTPACSPGFRPLPGPHPVDEEVLGLKVSMQDVAAVAEGETLQQLVHERLWERARARCVGCISPSTPRSASCDGPRCRSQGRTSTMSPRASRAPPKHTLTISGSKSPLQLSKYFFRSWEEASGGRVRCREL